MAKRVPFIIAIWLIVDLIFFQAVKTLTNNDFILWAYWLLDVFLTVGIVSVIFFRISGRTPQRLIAFLMALMLLSLVPKLVAAPVLILENIARLFTHAPLTTWEALLAFAVGAIPFLGLLFGLTRGQHYYKVHKETLYFDDLPTTFDGFTITQLSDIHSGSFSSEKGVEKGISIVNDQNSDLILFTGDLVNNKATEMDRWIPYFAKLKAPYGKYSVLGNHDYGDYIKWESKQQQAANLARLKEVHKEIGFRLLLDETVSIEKNGQTISLIGVENWGKGGFHQYGDLKRATENAPVDAFKVLMSHDPSHWEGVTLGHDKHVHLTLSGHTHGMQFGIELFGLRWSPIKYVYKQWAGLYQRNGKYLYVNRGFGFLGLRGRVGIWPEITVITLKKKR
jgi:uncharacterized protein